MMMSGTFGFAHRVCASQGEKRLSRLLVAWRAGSCRVDRDVARLGAGETPRPRKVRVGYCSASAVDCSHARHGRRTRLTPTRWCNAPEVDGPTLPNLDST